MGAKQFYFTKMQATGNDFILLDESSWGTSQKEFGLPQPTPEFFKKICDRRFGIGADQVLWLKNPSSPSSSVAGSPTSSVHLGDLPDVEVLFYNADGSSAEICGNGLRAIGLYLYQNQLDQNQTQAPDQTQVSVIQASATQALLRNTFLVQTPAGLQKVQVQVPSELKVQASTSLQVQASTSLQVTVSLGIPQVDTDIKKIKIAIPKPSSIDRSSDFGSANSSSPFGSASDSSSNLSASSTKIETEIEFYSVSVGNPHAVIFVDDLKSIDLNRLGPTIETHPFFPHRTNVEFVQNPQSHIGSGTSAKQPLELPRELPRELLHAKIWERGAGATLACGSGACALSAAAIALGKVKTPLGVKLPGGNLKIDWQGPNHPIYLTGLAQLVFQGTWQAD